MLSLKASPTTGLATASYIEQVTKATESSAALDRLRQDLEAHYRTTWHVQVRRESKKRFVALKTFPPTRPIFSIVSYLRWLIETWTPVLLSLPVGIIHPFDSATRFVFALVTSVLMFGLLIFDIVANLSRFAATSASVSSYFISGPTKERKAIFFANFPKEVREAAFKTLSAPSQSTLDSRVLPLEATMLLLALSTLIYSIKSVEVNRSVSVQADKLKRGQVVPGDSAAQGPVDSPDDPIGPIAKEDFGLEYCRLAFLNTPSSACVGAFFSREHPNFIIVAFKGTSPTEFADWVTDLKYEYTEDANRWLGPGYEKVHRGFFHQLFPQSDQSFDEGIYPYEAIRRGVIRIAEVLRAHQQGEPQPIRLYSTGHSLGAAISCNFFAKALRRPEEFNQSLDVDAGEVAKGSQAVAGSSKSRVVLGDAFNFGTPIFGDSTSLGTFNYTIDPAFNVSEHPLTCWRITNHGDAVATLLPELGDTSSSGPLGISDILGDSNQLAYAHVGQEIQLKSAPKLSLTGPGTQFVRGTDTKCHSSLLGVDAVTPKDASTAASNGKAQAETLSVLMAQALSVPKWLLILQEIPLLGRFVAHSPLLYAYQLASVKPTAARQSLPWASTSLLAQTKDVAERLQTLGRLLSRTARS